MSISCMLFEVEEITLVVRYSCIAVLEKSTPDMNRLVPGLNAKLVCSNCMQSTIQTHAMYEIVVSGA